MKAESWVENSLKELRNQHLERVIRTRPAVGGKIQVDGRSVINFSSNDYLNLAQHPAVLAASRRALEEYGAGSTASRLVTGSLPLHDELENRLARHKGYPAALVFGSGYMTNAGVISSLVGPGDGVFADRLVHASVIDAVALSRAKLVRFRHNDAGDLDRLLRRHGAFRRRLVITESVFSMDGDIAPLRDMTDIAEYRGAMLMIDEAHASGVFGPHGSGLIRAEGLEPRVNISMCTLSKAFGGYGGAVACSVMLRNWFVQRARAFIYTTAPPPASIGAALGALDVIEKEPNMGTELLARATAFRDRLRSGGLDTMDSASQIIPIMVGESERALSFSERLRDRDILAIAIRPPTVPRGTARLRLSVTLAHSPEDLDVAADTILTAARDEGIV